MKIENQNIMFVFAIDEAHLLILNLLMLFFKLRRFAFDIDDNIAALNINHIHQQQQSCVYLVFIILSV